MDIYFSKKRNIKIRIPGKSEQVQRVLLYIIAFLSAAAIVLGVICSVMYFGVRRLTVEAGQIKSAAELVGDAGAVFENGFDYTCLNRPGVYYFDVIVGDKTVSIRLQVEDRSAPVIKVKNVKCAVGGEYPAPEDYIDTVYEPDHFTGEYITPLPEIEKMGTYSAQVRFTDASGNKTKVFDVQVTVVVDIMPPEADLPEEVFTFLGEAPLLDVTLTDDCIGPLTYTVDYSRVDLTEEGSYEAYVIATDAVGNQSSPILFTVTVLPPAAEGEETS